MEGLLKFIPLIQHERYTPIESCSDPLGHQHLLIDLRQEPIG